jgi:hypothetical protein
VGADFPKGKQKSDLALRTEGREGPKVADVPVRVQLRH